MSIGEFYLSKEGPTFSNKEHKEHLDRISLEYKFVTTTNIIVTVSKVKLDPRTYRQREERLKELKENRRKVFDAIMLTEVLYGKVDVRYVYN